MDIGPLQTIKIAIAGLHTYLVVLMPFFRGPWNCMILFLLTIRKRSVQIVAFFWVSLKLHHLNMRNKKHPGKKTNLNQNKNIGVE